MLPVLIDDNSLETILVLIKQLQSSLLELKQMRVYVVQGVEQQMLESAIQDNETRLAEIRRKVIQ